VKRVGKWPLSVAAAVLALAGCGSGSSAPPSATAPASAAATASPSAPTAAATQVDPAVAASWAAPLTTVMTDDEFDDNRNGWKGAEGVYEIRDGTYVWTLPAGQTAAHQPAALLPKSPALPQLRVQTTVTVTGVLSVGFDCSYEDTTDSNQFYVLELSTSGASISKKPPNSPLETLASVPEPVLVEGQPVTLQAVCAHEGDEYHLALFLGGTPVVAAVDPDPLPNPALPALVVRVQPPSVMKSQGIATFDSYQLSALPPE
jgi:hypothetical protein